MVISNKSFWTILIGLAVLSWLDIVSDTTAGWIFAIIMLVLAGNYIEKRFDNLEDRIIDLENRNK